MPELANCARCGNIFAKTNRSICQPCFKQEEKDFETVYSFLKQRKNREATLQEIVAATEVDEKIIIKFIKEKRLRTSQFPKLAYPCERCGTSIVSGKLCIKCSEELKKDLDHYEKIEKTTNYKTNTKENVYFSYNKNNK